MSMIVVNTDFVPGKEIAEVLGIVKGNVRFMTSMVMTGAAEILAYRTAVKLR